MMSMAMWRRVLPSTSRRAAATVVLADSSAASRRPHRSITTPRAFSSTGKASEQARKWRAQKPEEKTKFLSISVDRSGLKQPSSAAPPAKSYSESLKHKTKENDLVHVLRTMIEVKGPLSVSEFMQRALGHPQHGYYMKKDVFGVKGDFTTAPEISQMFGELIGIWCVATWQQMGSPSTIKIVEMGPGRGSLMSDFLRAAKSFPPFYEALEIHMIDISPALREIQQKTLGCEAIDDASTAKQILQVPGGPTVRWHDDFANVPYGPSLFIAQELFDALPVHQFEYTDKGWCERLVDADYEDGEDHFRFVLSPGPTPATRVYIGRQKLFDPAAFQATGTVEPIRRLDVADPLDVPVKTEQAQVGDKIEISPLGIALAQDISKRIAEHGGGALIVDYGHDHPSELSLRGIKNHEFVSVLREPGDVDLSIDVDFATLRKYATADAKVSAFGPIGQGDFLKAMGIEHRLAMLLQNCETEAEQEELFSAYERLVNSDQMGTIFKAMAITHTEIGRPVGFEDAQETSHTAQ
ncbi:hypothetical protein Poli38472_008913 [Pythium oligandrum]|uniref:Protein arginine methyltransferase NDUFAF7 n=1 Tax=Pythium oligandrum TaxID=41045 RepID=A0A8K1FAI2_PYTOL|nr:hypothetical protein Poli38472_008913 [Pythium oligandrum]|eukprot:TMW56265.1 hypothetical protein Poli38472_008913 [Pythium oligandrum]